MKIKPLFTEKTSKLAKSGYYSFKVLASLTKGEIKKIIEEMFGVHVVKLKTANFKGIKTKDNKGKYKLRKAFKKVLVRLGKDEKIDLFAEGSKK